MGTAFYGVQSTNYQSNPKTLIEQGKYGGKIRRLRDKYVLTADLASGDTIDMGSPLPKGATLLNCWIKTEALGGSCTIDVGWSVASGSAETADNDGFFAALPVSSATFAQSRGNTYEGSTYYDKTLLDTAQVQVAEHAVSSGATGKAIWCEVDYMVD